MTLSLDQYIQDNLDPKTYAWPSIKALETFELWQKRGDWQNTLLYGEPGTGKSSFVALMKRTFNICKENGNLIDTDGMEDSDLKRKTDKQMAMLQSTRHHWGSILGGTSRTMIYIEEIDQLTPTAVNWLKTNMETLTRSGNYGFVGCSNHIDQLDSALISRFTVKISTDHRLTNQQNWKQMCLAWVSNLEKQLGRTVPDSVKQQCLENHGDCLREWVNEMDRYLIG